MEHQNIHIIIRLFGGFHLTVNGIANDRPFSHSPKGRMLLQYLLLRPGELITSSELARLLGMPSVSALKTLVSRTRVILADVDPELADCLATGPSGYLWVSGPHVMVDKVAFERAFQELISCTGLTPTLREQFENAISLYHGDLLGDMAQEEWLSERAAASQAMYTALVQRYLDLLQTEGDAQTMTRICRTALTMLPFNESLHRRMYEIISHSGQSVDQATARHYQTQLVHSSEALDANVAKLRATLLPTGNRRAASALVCDTIQQLHDVVHMNLRMLDRTKLSLYMGLFMVSSPGNKQLRPIHVDVITTSLVHHFARGLRRTDAVGRVDNAMVAVVLPAGSEESARIALERVTRNYLDQEKSGEFLLTYRLTKLG